MAKNNLMAKIDNIINSLKFNEQNFSENDIINKIKELNLEKLLKKENEFTKNELSKIEHIKKLRDIINKNKDSLREGNNIDIYYIFQEWKNSFNQSYKAEENFKKLVIYDEKIELSDIKKVASYLINAPSKEKIIISNYVPEYFKNIKFNILKESQFDSYFNKNEKK
jgi:Golgi nucleoside diphosphatase